LIFAVKFKKNVDPEFGIYCPMLKGSSYFFIKLWNYISQTKLRRAGKMAAKRVLATGSSMWFLPLEQSFVDRLDMFVVKCSWAPYSWGVV